MTTTRGTTRAPVRGPSLWGDLGRGRTPRHGRPEGSGRGAGRGAAVGAAVAADALEQLLAGVLGDGAGLAQQLLGLTGQAALEIVEHGLDAVLELLRHL